MNQFSMNRKIVGPIHPPHLPQPLADKLAYERLYAFNSGDDDYCMEGDWREIRIPRGLTAAEVYRRLPSAPNFEYGGYLTQTRIRYMVGEAERAHTITSRPCTFHSHPTDLPGRELDVPSASDIYSFLKWRNRRAITIGASLLWVFDKTRNTLRTVRRLAAWEGENMIPVCRRIFKGNPENFLETYKELALENVGLHWPRTLTSYVKHWPDLLRTIGIKVTVLKRFH